LKIIVGLGNPGPRFLLTRHNAGFMVIDALAGEFGVRVTKEFCRALVGSARFLDSPLLLAKPQTYMNLSGESVRDLLDYYKSGPSDLLVIHDDIDLSPSRLRIRKSGGDGGHNGIASIISAIGTGEFVRVKLGVGRPPEGWDPADYVLSNWKKDEEEIAADMVGRAAEAVLVVLRDGPEQAMNRFNSGLD